MTAAPRVSVILPTFNERSALESLAPRLRAALRAFTAEILVVDDGSPDGTGELVRSLEAEGTYRLIERPAKNGLASAVMDGFREARGEIVVVMDADGSHPPETIPALIGPVAAGAAEMVVASRHLPGASAPGLAGFRRWISSGASLLARPLTPVSDPMSGFFAVRRDVLSRATLAPAGYKIGLEVLVKCRPYPVAEVPFCFDHRIAGSSKLGGGQIVGYLGHVSRLYAFRLFPTVRAPTPAGLTLVSMAAPEALYYSRAAGAERGEDRAEAHQREARRPRFADHQILSGEIEQEPRESARYGEREETAREQSEGAFATAAPRADRVIAH
ncbi:MAG TPA: polyprenol monophosphomannose synthase [Thermoplasmata archaeon]|nr:polyprenol monophosphomannose synthase [Thermoplasmata archaeon]